MKTLLTWVFMTGIFSSAICQKMIQTKSDCAMATQRHIEQTLSVEEQLALQNDLEKMSILDYVYSSSYSFSSNQMVLKSQKALFNIEKYERMRQQSCNTVIFDEASGLSVTLFSLDEVDRQISQIRLQFQLAESSANKTN